MGYNYHTAFIENRPATICQACCQELAMAAVLRYKHEHPDATGMVNINVNTVRRVVIVDAVPIAEYTWAELGISPC